MESETIGKIHSGSNAKISSAMEHDSVTDSSMPIENMKYIEINDDTNIGRVARILEKLKSDKGRCVMILFNGDKSSSTSNAFDRPKPAVVDPPSMETDLGPEVDNREQEEDNLTPPCFLTQREIEVLKLLALGKSNKEVANDLGISTRTVEAHRLNIRHKSNCFKLSDLVNLARYYE